ncbi:hypothetical protein [Erythrobacter sp.]|uniref:hypothetical protein n=1 Tax=Erythrobacter sp. TaxID=1042 RepID=UPI0025F3982A|nr:hypothetical protein [Erythrobacter sp.]
MRRFITATAFALAWLAAGPLAAEPAEQTPRAVVERAVAAHGGALWLDPGTLELSGTATFYDPATGAVRSTAEDYRMWRTFEDGRTAAHDASGKVRIIARSGDKLLFEVGYDGETTWTERGIMPRAEADAYWASNFGFGIIRSALEAGFELHHAPVRDIGGRSTNIIRIRDPQGQQTLFGFDADSGFITYMAFGAPRGWHERLYSDFVRLENGWVQARQVTLLYDGIIANRVFWSEARTGESIDPTLFQPPAP